MDSSWNLIKIIWYESAVFLRREEKIHKITSDKSEAYKIEEEEKTISQELHINATKRWTEIIFHRSIIDNDNDSIRVQHVKLQCTLDFVPFFCSLCPVYVSRLRSMLFSTFDFFSLLLFCHSLYGFAVHVDTFSHVLTWIHFAQPYTW